MATDAPLAGAARPTPPAAPPSSRTRDTPAHDTRGTAGQPGGAARRTPAHGAILPILTSAPLLLWPAALNGYPLVFADTGTYLSQAIDHYIGWDRPPFYSLFMLPLHLTLTTWPVIIVQALLTAHVLHLLCRTLLPRHDGRWLVPLVIALSGFSWLPWLVCQLMPDLFTPLLVLVLGLLLLVPGRLGRLERAWLVGFAAFMIAAQQSSLLLAFVLLPVLALLRWACATPGPAPGRGVLLAPLLAMAALATVNLAAHGRASLSPFGNVFMLARVVYDGPGMAVLRRDCPVAHWRLCAELDRFPPTSDAFLWAPDGPIMRAGGHKLVSTEADAIIAAALRADPAREMRAFLANWAEQLGRFASGDGLEAWPDTVTPWIDQDFPPSERAAYAGARQTRGVLVMPPWMPPLHAAVALAGVALCVALLPGAARRRDPAAGFIALVLLSLLAGAAITGGLSTPHDRYQARLMWLPPCIGALALANRHRARTAA